ncbi:Uncharacterised protein [Serratia rubidaea]|uniref:DUF3592 domain-containing protein n=1 Tax=Serratia rubidaea TaxID=61652 RepID=A0A447QLE6_SERRU|nr:hypothetical protein [Serratia rubidaea]MDK1706476.1 hypothetical protein [Serratia rubidaea]VEA70885.1 Uncharacterised protein [Serratia rubidaea]
MSFISQYSGLIIMAALALTFLMIFGTLRGLKGQGDDLTKIKHWLSKDRWKGEIKEALLVSWRQTNATNNLDYYFVFTFEMNIDGENKQYSAASVVRVSEVPKLKPGLPIIIKYDGVPPEKIAVMSVDYKGE